MTIMYVCIPRLVPRVRMLAWEMRTKMLKHKLIAAVEDGHFSESVKFASNNNAHNDPAVP